MTDTTTISENQQPFAWDVEEQLRVAASWDVMHRPTGAGVFSARVHAAGLALKALERDLSSKETKTASDESVNSAIREMRANKRMLRSALRTVAEMPRVVDHLPRIVQPAGNDEPRIAAISASYFRLVDWDFSETVLRLFIQGLQKHEPLTLDELWNLPAFLDFILLESILDKAGLLLQRPHLNPVLPIGTHLKSLRSISNADWQSLIEPLILFDSSLRQDPAHAYAAMDFSSREMYRHRVAFVAHHSDCTESEVAQAVLDLAREHQASDFTDPRIQRREIHVGYYLIDKGFPRLALRTGFHPSLIERLRTMLRAHPDDFYISGIQILTVLFIGILILLPLPHFNLLDCLEAALVLLLPVMQCAVDLVNSCVTTIFEPVRLPKLDFDEGIPDECTTLVAVPSLLLNEAQVRALVNDLEVRFLANRDPRLHFALLTDLSDSASKPHTNDGHPLVELAVQLIGELNEKYCGSDNAGFILLHRHRTFNVRQGVWMGWERKRGKLLDLNKFLTGEFDAFPIKAGRLEVLGQTIRYVLTLDSDTQLPRGAASRLIGTIAHPLHQAVIHPKRRIVTEGFGILQPRIGVSVRSASRSRLAAIFSGQSGFDIYTRAISDAYQDLYGEGIFTGKGIYEVKTLHAVLNHRFPRNSLLSHDLIEGAYARAGLASDIELIDDYPSHLSAYNRRKHRWVRGDWQIAQWMFSRVPEESGRLAPNPVSEVSRWKIFDNLRRSLVEPLTFMVFVAGWLGLPGGPLYWTIVPLVLLIFPTIVQFSFGLSRAFLGGQKGSVGEALSGFWKAAFIALMSLIFLPQQTLLSLDAIIRSLVRGFITGDRLLEWETAAQAELHSANGSPIDRYLIMTPLVSISVAYLVYFVNPHRSHVLLVAAPILMLWVLAPLVTAWLNARPREQRKRIDSSDESFLLAHALRIWRFFCQFGGENHNYLIPDNVEEEGLFEAAHISPTNLGLLLNARQAACEFGFLTCPEFVSFTIRTLATVARLEKYRGHLYNWYNTKTLEPLDDARFVSSVDSGNLVVSLYTLRSGALELVGRPLLSPRLFTGLRAHWQLMSSQGCLPTKFAQLTLPDADAPISECIEWLFANQPTLSGFSTLPTSECEAGWWATETSNRVSAIIALVRDYTPWLLPEYATLRELPELKFLQMCSALGVEETAAFAKHLDERVLTAWPKFIVDSHLLALVEQLVASLPAAARNLQAIETSLHSIAQQAEGLAEETKFAFLADPNRQVLSVGYDARAEKLSKACYDMIASEARIAMFLAIARDEIHQRSWFKLSRVHTRAFRHFLLLSWTGTMFEYLMPALWMRSYPDTLVSRTLVACVQVQRAFVRNLKIPWGISESGASRKDDLGHYQYQAYGIPQAALSIEATAGPVISPYATCLALGVDALAALRNLRWMVSSGWVGAFGFYEAADFSSGKPILVREWMAHHQGMSLLAILNLLQDNVVQRWFHANPMVQATELLLHDMPVSKAILRAHLND